MASIRHRIVSLVLMLLLFVGRVFLVRLNTFPVVGGNYFEFFSAIFNVADAAITIGVIWLILELAILAPKAQKANAEEKKSKTEMAENK